MIPRRRSGATRRIELVGGETPGPGGSGPEKREVPLETGFLGAEDLHWEGIGGPKNPDDALPLRDAKRDSPPSNFTDFAWCATCMRLVCQCDIYVARHIRRTATFISLCHLYRSVADMSRDISVTATFMSLCHLYRSVADMSLCHLYRSVADMSLCHLYRSVADMSRDISVTATSR